MGSEGPYVQERLDEIVLLRAVMNVALNDLSGMPPHDVAVELAAVARRAWERISALLPLDNL
jgi:hypothetical protein